MILLSSKKHDGMVLTGRDAKDFAQNILVGIDGSVERVELGSNYLKVKTSDCCVPVSLSDLEARKSLEIILEFFSD